MKCPECDHENPSSAKFCRNCGAKLPSICPECGKPVNPQDRFCMECGARLLESEPTKTGVAVPKLEDMHSQLQSLIPEELAQKYATAEPQAAGENRPITALFADISGFTPLSSTQSSETMLQLVQDCFRQLVGIVARYEGIISGFRGDGLLALFGAPILHENDAERAIRAAMDMRNAMHERQLEVTIGINTAPMTVGEIQTQLHREYTAYGTDVILASRLQDAAQPGQILAGTGTHRLTRRIFDFQVVHDLELQGFPQPVTAYVVQQVKVHPEKLRGIEGLRSRMIGREHEFAELKEVADLWLQGQGQMVSIIGEAGIGKSRLVAELRQYLDTGHETRDVRQEDDDTTSLKSQVSGLKSILEGRCVSIGQPISYWPFIDILRTYFGFREEDDTPAIARKVTESITSLMPQGAEETLPLLGNLLSIKYGDELDDRLKFASPEQIRHQTLMRLRDIFETLARQRPLMLILEDLHWADDLSLDLVSLLMDELANTPIMLLCVYRPEKEHRVWQLSDQAHRKCLDRYTEIRLNPLSSLQSRQLVESLLEIENLPENVKNTILERAEGNPFFIEEVIRSLIEQDMIYHEDEHWKARDEIADIHVPDTIQSIVLARVDRLRAEARYVLQCASVIGRLFRHRLLQHIAHQEQNLDRYIADFENKELIYEERTVPELEYAFKHAFTQEATYESILEQRRKEFHHQVAEGIERLYQERLDEYYEELAYHYSRSNDRRKAQHYLFRAGQKAASRYANQEALNYFQMAMDIAESDKEREYILKTRAKLFLDLYRGEEAASDYKTLLGNATSQDDKQAQLDSMLGLASAYYSMALDEPKFAQSSLDTYEKAYTLACELGDEICIIRSLIPTGWFIDFWVEYREQAVANAREALALSQKLGNEDLIIDSKMIVLYLAFKGLLDWPDGTEALGTELAVELKSRHDLTRLKEVYFQLMLIHYSLGDFRKVVEDCDAAIDLAAEIGVLPVQYATRKALALMNLGDYRAAWESLQQEIADDEHQFSKAFRDFGIGCYFLEVMAYDKACEVLESVVKQAKELRRPWLVSWAQRKLISSLIRSNQFDQSSLDRAKQNLESMGEKLSYMEIDLFKGRADEVLERARTICLNAKKRKLMYSYLYALEISLQALLELDRLEDLIPLADEGLEVAEQIDYLPMLWHMRVLKAQALEKIGDREGAVQDYRAAGSVIQELAETIPDAELKMGFLADVLVTKVLAFK